MTGKLYEYIRPRRRSHHQTMVALDRWLKDGYRSGELVKMKKGRKKRPKETD